MPDLILGPLLRYASTDDATIWVQADAACEVEVRPEGLAPSRERTFTVHGRHYALVHVTGLPADAATPYEVALDGDVVWPAPDSAFPRSVLRTHSAKGPVRIAFGSCRVAVPNEPPYSLRKDEDPEGREVDALRGLAQRMARTGPEEWPHALLMLGDQVYADEVHPDVQDRIDGEQVVEYDEYAQLYCAAWGEPTIRWLLSTVPSAMIFDDHDVHDDWNTSLAWVEEMRRTEWWRTRVIAAFESYYVYQHLGNLPPAELEREELYQRLRTERDPTAILRAFAERADREVDGTRWSFCRDIGPARVVMVDSRAGRVLTPGHRSMVDAAEWEWISEHARGDVEHLLIGTSLPLILAPALHHLEAWNEAICDGAWGRHAARAGEKLRQTLDLEHWAAFGTSFEAMCELLREVGSGRRGRAPETITVLSGDVHHAYLAQIGFPPGAGVSSSVWQAVCSPFRNPLDTNERRTILTAWTPAATRVARALSRAAGVGAPPVDWRLVHDEPWFNNQVGWIEVDGPRARFLLEKAVPEESHGGQVQMERVFSRPIEPNRKYART
ncbi:alkaline phosphatase D family protein [Candidatus Solirubrobacter pratensis]|uniref:alkaline phosphatase D family protein n=1 Tax=Candidatus Solirubrobacter pratensis TaxID=1298857 RepID=UPI0003FC5014|nr:alkaline phosphatase D family protein [Candidatus Solirubrobacter pratensis]